MVGNSSQISSRQLIQCSKFLQSPSMASPCLSRWPLSSTLRKLGQSPASCLQTQSSGLMCASFVTSSHQGSSPSRRVRHEIIFKNLYVIQKIGAGKVQWAQHFINRGFEALEPILKQTAGKYCVGDEISMADICLVPQVYNAERFKVDMSQFPTIRRLNQTLIEIDAFKVSHPSHQPDTPDDLQA
ncbi:maleylacetoacetate isomerase isoform X3 [Chanodichthys erythropterus]|uniref:maleylacetoacetate isomerase isoform X3 n=1 Tax=Chanodichthys erythropterus TaxID=933992 RepID=UPI00351DBAD8